MASSALMLLVGWHEGHPACINWVLWCWRGYLSGVRCRLVYCPADVTATHCLLLHQNPDWFYLSLSNDSLSAGCWCWELYVIERWRWLISHLLSWKGYKETLFLYQVLSYYLTFFYILYIVSPVVVGQLAIKQMIDWLIDWLSLISHICELCCCRSNPPQRLHVCRSSPHAAWTSVRPSFVSNFLPQLHGPCTGPPTLRHPVFHAADVRPTDTTSSVSQHRSR